VSARFVLSSTYSIFFLKCFFLFCLCRVSVRHALTLARVRRPTINNNHFRVNTVSSKIDMSSRVELRLHNIYSRLVQGVSAKIYIFIQHLFLSLSKYFTITYEIDEFYKSNTVRTKRFAIGSYIGPVYCLIF
jgi:hypothetical protein